ncbi:GNAT family N-acetyltransferase [Nocardioides acrostichi]|uniref:GNAT family N-acetyltransferase n=1 Tax=Nocardioides acrostichi TaxID=2784339 RepID=A0A930Y9S4_9ACTN|nr:GNAT family N-acetyltransferase [Nocardioides acrostichi]MBF4160673.1 GNAT family N-acetyltransferase [Nocardioides acrostichi]
MARPHVTLRTARPDDLDFLLGLWSEMLRRCDGQDQRIDLELVLKDSAESTDQRVVVADVDGVPAGAVLLRIAPLSPLNPELSVQAWAPHVLPAHRRHGVGRHLVEAAADFAEESGVGVVLSGATAGAREANRFLARLGLSPYIMLRGASTHSVRQKAASQLPTSERGQHRRGAQLAARRTLRQRRTRADG